MKFFGSIINHKINTITAEELLKYAEIFKIALTTSEASKIAAYLRGKQVNIFNDMERTKLIKEIAIIAGPETAKEINRLFIQFSK